LAGIVSNLWPHTVTIKRATLTEDEFGNQERNWGSASATDEDMWSVQPLDGIEVVVGRETIVSRWSARRLGDSILLATDRVVHKGETYDVDGEVQRFQDFPPLDHVSCILRRSESS
jgi:hypothetical protein